jgi:hypothetical protein
MDDAWHTVDALKHRLLYCHSVAVDDAFGYLLYRSSSSRRSEATRERLLNYVNFLLHVGPLLRSHVLCLVSSESYVPALAADRRRGNRAQPSTFKKRLESTLTGSPALEHLDFREIMAVAPDDVRQEWAQALESSDGRHVIEDVNLDAACERVAMSIGAAANAPGALSVYFPFRYDVELLSAYERLAVDPQSPALQGAAEAWLLSALIDVELPGLAALDPDELVSIRTQSEEFENWRKALRQAVMRADAFPRHLPGRSAAVKREIGDLLQEGKKRLEASLPKSVALKALRKGAVSMLAGTVSAAIVLLLDPDKTVLAALYGLAGVAGSASATALAEPSEAGDGKARRAALAHYVAMLR